MIKVGWFYILYLMFYQELFQSQQEVVACLIYDAKDVDTADDINESCCE